MEWLLRGPQLQNTGSQLGVQIGNSYRVNDTCLETLEELLAKLSTEDRTLRTFRRALGFSQIIQKDLVPLLIYEKEDSKIIDAAVRLLVNLTVPVECLLPVEIMARTDAGRHTIYELNSLLSSAKEAFVEPRSTRSVLDFMRKILDQHLVDVKPGEETEKDEVASICQKDVKLTLEQCEGINNCLLLIRNILHIPEPWALVGPTGSSTATPSPNGSKQNIILWNLFAQGVDKVLIHLMTCPQKAYWSITMVQLIALTYKDQHVGTLQKLLNVWFEASLSESSEDNESNTSPPEQGSGDSSPMVTSDPTSDSSDNGSGSKNAGPDGSAAKQHAHKLHTDHGKVVNKMSAEIAARKCQQNTASASTSGAWTKGQHKKDKPAGNGGGGTDQQAKLSSLSIDTSSSSTSKRQHPSGDHQQAGSSSSEPQTPALCTPSNTDNPPTSPTPSSSSSGHMSATTSQSSSLATPPLSAANTNNNTSTVTDKNTGTSSSPKKMELSSSELSDCGYGTQVENQESVSTSSNEEDSPQNANVRGAKPVHQKPHTAGKARPHKTASSPPSAHDHKEWRRKKLVKRSRASILNIKALTQHSPTDEDISNLLKEFTVDFLLKGYGALVQELHSQLLSDLGVPVDTSHFFWLVTYFLKFAAQLELELENISPVLSYKVISYLTFEGVNLSEQLQLAYMQQELDLKPCLRRLHLVVTAIREFIQAMDMYKKLSHLSLHDKEHLSQLQSELCSTADLRYLFLLLLRQYNPSVQSKQYLQDLISTNHMLLLCMENNSSAGLPIFDVVTHIKHFATAEMMLQYGRLLESFRDNGKFVNDCVFTMMHHIAGDLNLVSTLFQPGILKTFSLIWEEDFEVCDDWSDLIEYVIHKFVNTPRLGHPMLPPFQGSVESSLVAQVVPEITQPTTLEQNTCRWSQEDYDNLYWYFEQSSTSTDTIGNILQLFVANGSPSKSRVGVIEQLYTQDIINHAQYLELLKMETKGLQPPTEDIRRESGENSLASVAPSVPTILEVLNEEDQEDIVPPPQQDDISSLIGVLLAEGHAPQLKWLQSMLLEACYVKLYQYNLLAALHTMEPVPYHYTLMRQSIPLVPWSLDQSTVLMHPPFVLLLHKLGFHLPGDVGKVFPRIPHFWTAKIVYTTAQKLGPINHASLKFGAEEVSKSVGGDVEEGGEMQVISSEPAEENMPGPSHEIMVVAPQKSSSTPSVRFAPTPSTLPTPTPNWMQLVNQSKQLLPPRATEPPRELGSGISKMSISDEDSSAQNSSTEESPK